MSASLADTVRLSANWMAACGEPGEDAALYDAVRAVGMELCPALGIAIPGGQGLAVDEDACGATAARSKSVVAPVSLIVSAFAPVGDVRKTLTPQLRLDSGARRAAAGGPRTGRIVGWVARSLAQVYGELGDEAPDLDVPRAARRGLAAALAGVAPAGQERVLAYHDLSDGGLFATLTEMAFAGRCGAGRQVAGGRATVPRGRCSAKSWAWCCSSRVSSRRGCVRSFVRHGLGPDAHARRRHGHRSMHARGDRGGGRNHIDESWKDLRARMVRSLLPPALAARRSGMRARRIRRVLRQVARRA